MAAPSPYWKRKTRPCPFYSQGRCLFSDSCNFVHSVKVNPSSHAVDTRVVTEEPVGVEAGTGQWKPSEHNYNGEELTRDGGGEKERLVGDEETEKMDVMSSKRSSSAASTSRRRRSVMSPPRSPRLSGLLTLLEPLIGPDVEELEDLEEGEEDDEAESRLDQDMAANPEVTEEAASSSLGLSGTVLEMVEVQAEEETSVAVDDDLKPAINSPQVPSITSKPLPVRGKIPAPIITHSTRPRSVFCNPISGNTLEIRSLRPQSTLGLLTSPLLSPILRLQSPAFFSEQIPLPPSFTQRTRSEDDLDSPDPLELAKDRYAESVADPLDMSSEDESSGEYSEIIAETSEEESLDSIIEHLDLNVGSPQETERPLSDSSRTPPAPAQYHDNPANELDLLPTLPPSQVGQDDTTDSATVTTTDPDPVHSSIYVLSDEENIVDDSKDDSYPPLSEPPVTINRDRTHYLTPITIDNESRSILTSPSTSSLGPSPVSTDVHTSYTSDTLIEPDIEDGWDGSDNKEKLLLSPNNVLSDSFILDSNQKTIRIAPSPLRDDSFSSDSSLSQMTSNAEICDNFGGAQVAEIESIDFRQSISSDGSRLARSPQESQMHPDIDSMGNMSPTSSRSYSIHEPHTSRARSASPALFSHNKDNSIRANSDPPIASPSVYVHPRSASQLEFVSDQARSESPLSIVDSDSSRRRPHWMRPLRLSQLVHNSIYSNHSSPRSASFVQKRYSTVSSSAFHNRNISQGTSVNNSMRNSARSSLISAYLNDSETPMNEASRSFPQTPSSHAQPFPSHQRVASIITDKSGNMSGLDLLSPLSGSMRGFDFNELSRWQWPGSTRNSISSYRPTVSAQSRRASVAPTSILSSNTPRIVERPLTPTNIVTPSHAIATPRPTLIFAIASDDPKEVERVLSEGEARPDDDVGPQSALEFALTNEALNHKTEIVKLLLAYGANPNILPLDVRNAYAQHTGETKNEPDEEEEKDDVLSELPSEGSVSVKRRKRESVLNPAMKYYLNRAGGSLSSAALRRTDFRSLGRMRFDFVGQDRALEHLYWVLSMHSQQPIGTPLVVLCCGPSGHGKSLLARKFGSLLDVPTHTVNMTILKTSHDLWQCPSMSPYEQPSQRTLAEFLSENEGKRCVVVLDEIDKNEDERTLWSLLAPWELGRCSIDAGRQHIDVRNVIWLGTSNIGQDLIFEHHDSRPDANTVISKPEYRELMNLLRPRVTERLGTSLMSRVTAVLPFVPFTEEEKLAIASEAILALGDERASEFSAEEFERLAGQCVAEYVKSEGARSLYRSVSTHLMELF